MSKPLSLEAETFPRFRHNLCAEFPIEYGLPRRLLGVLDNPSKSCTLEQLGELAASWCPLTDKSALPPDAFRKLVLHALALLRGAAIYLRRMRKNPEGWIVTRPPANVPEGEVKWVRDPEAMDKIIAAA
jgi:hypothetical protein